MWDNACRGIPDPTLRRSSRVASGCKRRTFFDEEPDQRAKSSEAVSTPKAALAVPDRASGSCEKPGTVVQVNANGVARQCNGNEERLDDDATCRRDEAVLEKAVPGSMSSHTATGTCTAAQGSPCAQASVGLGRSEAPAQGEEAGMADLLVGQHRAGQKLIRQDSNDSSGFEVEVLVEPSDQPSADAACSSAEEPLTQRLLDAYDVFDERHQEFMQWHE